MQTVRLPRPYDQRAAGSPNAIVGEKHVIGEDNETGWITLNEAPETAAGVTIAGYTRVVGAPAAGEFRVYATATERLYGKIEFNAADDGDDIAVSYSGMGTPSAASSIRRIHEILRHLGVNFLSYQDTAVADYDAMFTAMMADISDGTIINFPGGRTYSFDKHNLGAIGHADMRWIGGPGCVFKKKVTGTFGTGNTQHMFYDKASTCDGLQVFGIEFDLSRSSAAAGDTVSAFMLVRVDRVRFSHCKFRDGIEEGLKTYKCWDLEVADCEFNNIRNNGIQIHAPPVDGYTGVKANRGWERITVRDSYFVDIDDGAGGALDGEGVTFNSTDNTVVCKSGYVYGCYFLRCIRGIHSEGNPQLPGPSACWMDDLHIFDNTVRDSLCHGIIIGGARYSHVHHNTVINPGQTGNVTGGAFGIKMTGTNGATPQPSKHCTMDHNVVYDDRGGSAQMTVGIFVTVCEDFVVEHNDAQGAITGQNHICIPDDCKRGFFMPGHALPSVKMKITAGSSHSTSGSYEDVPFGGTVKWNKWGTTLHDPASSNERFKVPTYSVDGGVNNGGLPGVWRMRANIIFPTDADTTKRGARIVYSNGSEVLCQASGAADATDDWAALVEAEVEMGLLENLRIQAMQGSGAALSYSNLSWAQFDYTGRVKPNAI